MEPKQFNKLENGKNNPMGQEKISHTTKIKISHWWPPRELMMPVPRESGNLASSSYPRLGFTSWDLLKKKPGSWLHCQSVQVRLHCSFAKEQIPVRLDYIQQNSFPAPLHYEWGKSSMEFCLENYSWVAVSPDVGPQSKYEWGKIPTSEAKLLLHSLKKNSQLSWS